MSAERLEAVFFDSNVYINLLRFPEYERDIERFIQGNALYVINKIVFMELWAGVRTKKEEGLLRYHQNSFSFIGLSDDNFLAAGHVMRAMNMEYRFEPRMRRRLTWDILIALSAKENNALLVTENTADFSKIQRFVNFEFALARD